MILERGSCLWVIGEVTREKEEYVDFLGGWVIKKREWRDGISIYFEITSNIFFYLKDKCGDSKLIRVVFEMCKFF